MKFLRYIFFSLLGLYVLVFASAATLFSVADNYPTQFKQFLSRQLNLTVEFDQFVTTWQSGNPSLLLRDFSLSDAAGEEYFRFEHLAARSTGYSWLYFWPQFSTISLEAPKIALESLLGGGLKVAGVSVEPSRNKNKPSMLFLTWILSQKRVDVHAGSFDWRHTDGSQTQFNDIAASYKRKGDNRRFIAKLNNKKGAVGVNFDIDGNVLFKDDWSAALQVLTGEQLDEMAIRQVDLKVENGRGEFIIPELYAERAMDIVRMFGAGSRFERTLLQADVKGQLQNIRLGFAGSLIDLDDWDLTAQGRQLSWSSSDTLPGVSDIDLQFSVDKRGGVLDFSVQDAAVTWPEYLSSAIPVLESRGRVRMQFGEHAWHLQVADAYIKNTNIALNDIDLAYDAMQNKAGYAVASVDLQTDQLNALESYFPNKTRAQFRQWWRQAFVNVAGAQGQLSYIGDTDKWALSEKRARVLGKAVARNVQFDYGHKRAWPVLESDLVNIALHEGDLLITTERAQLQQVQVSKVRASIDEIFSRNRVLRINADLAGPAAHLVEFLQTGPLIKKTAAVEPIQYVKALAGEYQGTMSLELPLRSINDAVVEGQLTLTDGEIVLPSAVTASAVNGVLNFTQESVTASDVKAHFLGGEMLLNVSTVEPGKPPKVRLSGAGQAQIAELTPWIGSALTSRMSGNTDWSGYVDISKEGVKVDVESALHGIEVAFPPPFAKTQDETVGLELVFNSGPQLRNNLHLNYGDDSYMHFQALSERQGNLLDSAQIVIGPDQAKRQAFVSTEQNEAQSDSEKGIHIEVMQDTIDLDQWIETVTSLSKVKTKAKPNSVKFVDQLRRIDLTTDHLRLFNKDLQQAHVVATSADGKAWPLNITGENIAGYALLQPFSRPAKYSLKLQHLTWPHQTKKDIVAPEELGQLNDTRLPSTWPAVDISVERFHAIGKSLGRMSMLAEPVRDQWLIRDFRLNQEGAEVVGTGAWIPQAGGGTVTKLNLKLISGSVGSALQELGFAGLVDDGRIEFSTGVDWRGAPSDFTLARLNGDYQLLVRKGRFPKVNAKSGRFLGLLNANSLSRRLRLDFKDVFSDGLVFDRMVSEGVVVQGDILLKSFFIYSPAVYIQANGRVGLAKEDYDMQLLVSPQLGGNLALLSALTNPAAGAVVFLAQKVFKKQFDQAVVYTYTVDGAWDNPQIQRFEGE